MKKKLLTVFLLLAASAAVIAALAAGGDSSDPLISLSYINGTYTSKIDTAVDARLDTSDQAIRSEVTSGSTGGSTAAASSWTETRLKQNDVLSGSTGLNIMVLAGGVRVSYSSGALVDATAGTVIASGTVLTARHRYLVAEDTQAGFTVSTPTAVVDYQGGYTFSYSSAPDYNAMASALKTIHLFRGTYTGYGSGYDLEVAPNRLQALIMFIRVLGEEDAALAYTGTTPFTDVTPGSLTAKYVGYAYSRGYTNGYTATLFKPALQISANQYTEFMLRALGYSSVSNSSLSDTLLRAKNAGVLTSGEVSALQSQQFLRAHLVYVSYYALNATISGKTSSLRDVLITGGVFTAAESQTAQALVTTSRID